MQTCINYSHLLHCPQPLLLYDHFNLAKVLLSQTVQLPIKPRLLVVMHPLQHAAILLWNCETCMGSHLFVGNLTRCRLLASYHRKGKLLPPVSPGGNMPGFLTVPTAVTSIDQPSYTGQHGNNIIIPTTFLPLSQIRKSS